ncbi:hypothetical protein [uncultured Shewanella sp.]|uniref:hypothetical protein n=1 Tax=uncultured Shewanella sp. TaxID=173975 RepID=UPI00261A2554|nr:hypothetical protein [uncultured Shewanella sp.]
MSGIPLSAHSSYFNHTLSPNINDETIINIQETGYNDYRFGSTLDKITTVIEYLNDKLKDWFFGTDIVQVKEALHVLLHEPFSTIKDCEEAIGILNRLTKAESNCTFELLKTSPFEPEKTTKVKVTYPLDNNNDKEAYQPMLDENGQPFELLETSECQSWRSITVDLSGRQIG